MNVKYVGTSDTRTLLAEDIDAKEDLVFQQGVPTEITKKVWEVIKKDESYAGEFEETDEEPPAPGEVYVPPPHEPEHDHVDAEDEHQVVSLADPDFQPLTAPPDQVESPPQDSDDEQIDDDDSEIDSTDSGKNS